MYRPAVVISALLAIGGAVACQSTPPAPAASPADARAAMDRDLLDVTVAGLHRFYDAKTYTVTQVVQWHLDRIDRYNGVYGAIETVFREGALARAAALDAEAAKGGTADARGALWGVPIVIKANTSIEGEITTAGWEGFHVAGHELVAPKDATVVAKFKAAGAVIVGHSNMPDLANSDTNRSTSFGRTGNAYDVRFSPGGSSGGTVTAITASAIAASSAVRAIGPVLSSSQSSGAMPAMLTRPRVGNTPTRPLVAAGMRIELPVSVPLPSTAKFAATAVTVPPDDPPGEKRTS